MLPSYQVASRLSSERYINYAIVIQCNNDFNKNDMFKEESSHFYGAGGRLERL